MNFPRYKAGPIEYWLCEALTQFINGAISGFKIGASVGVFSGGGVAASDLGDKVSPLFNSLISVAGIALTCLGSGLARFHDWHKTNEIPNPWPKPASNNQTLAQ